MTKERLINSGFYDLATAYQSVHVNYWNRRVPNGTHGGVRGRRLVTASYSIQKQYFLFRQKEQKQSFKCVDVFADDAIETANHFRCIDMIIDHAKAALTEKRIWFKISYTDVIKLCVKLLINSIWML